MSVLIMIKKIGVRPRNWYLASAKAAMLLTSSVSSVAKMVTMTLLRK